MLNILMLFHMSNIFQDDDTFEIYAYIFRIIYYFVLLINLLSHIKTKYYHNFVVIVFLATFWANKIDLIL